MDFHSLPRRDLQFFCKKNKIPANMTNIAMADALKALEIVDGIDEFVNQSESTRDQSPTSVAKNLPSAARTAARTTRRKTKDETQQSDLVTRSCLVTSKSLAGELEQENRNTNVLQNPSVPQSRRRAAATSIAINLEGTDMKSENNVIKTPAARSTRRAQSAASSKKDESVQRVYSTRRSVKLLEESMADLSLKTKESLNVLPKKNEDAERENSPEGSEFKAKSDDNSEKTEDAEVISVRDLNASLEKECDGSKNDPDLDILYGDLGDITFSDANTSTEQMNGIESSTVPTLQEDDFVVVGHEASCNKQSESEQMKNVSESNVSASGNVSMVNSVPTVLIADESKDLESYNDSGESCESDEVALVSDKKTTQDASSSTPHDEKELETDSEWSESDFEISDVEENIYGSKELIGSETEEALISFEAGSVSDPNNSASNLVADINNKNNENAEEIVLGERESEAEAKKTKKKPIDEESLKDVSMRQLTKMVKELALKSKQQHKCAE
ncbi:uncharacterized protein LOC18023387 [Eutrema salsugineum]|uniref:uncharacterized protein LOC18023387 n=1 Tax=Eutrema salsugineum TaxID=72664 RepID=UPI000CED30B4|nr:uncharacterized protein LOC18023387 [Eutrema salsugineum]